MKFLTPGDQVEITRRLAQIYVDCALLDHDDSDHLVAQDILKNLAIIANFAGGKKMRRAVPELAKQIVDVVIGKETDND